MRHLAYSCRCSGEYQRPLQYTHIRGGCPLCRESRSPLSSGRKPSHQGWRRRARTPAHTENHRGPAVQTHPRTGLPDQPRRCRENRERPAGRQARPRRAAGAGWRAGDTADHADLPRLSTAPSKRCLGLSSTQQSP